MHGETVKIVITLFISFSLSPLYFIKRRKHECSRLRFKSGR